MSAERGRGSQTRAISLQIITFWVLLTRFWRPGSVGSVCPRLCLHPRGLDLYRVRVSNRLAPPSPDLDCRAPYQLHPDPPPATESHRDEHSGRSPLLLKRLPGVPHPSVWRQTSPPEFTGSASHMTLPHRQDPAHIFDAPDVEGFFCPPPSFPAFNGRHLLPFSAREASTLHSPTGNPQAGAI